MRAMLLRSLVPTVVLCALLAAPAHAQVQQPLALSPLKSCYLVAQQEQREMIAIAASGFTPFSTVDVFLDDILQTPATVLYNGDVEGKVRAPWEPDGTRTFTLRLSEVGNPANTITDTSKVTRLGVQQSPRSASTTDKVRFKGRGFMDLAAPVYAHYVFAGKVRKTVNLGLPKGPCGTFNARRTQFPFKKRPSRGRWTIQFDQFAIYNPNAPVRVPMTITVKKTLKPQRAQAR